MHTTSLSLIQRLADADGQHPDWERFDALYRPLLVFWAEHRLGMPRDMAEDLAQEVLVLMLDKLPKFAPGMGSGFRAWLRTVALNKGRDCLRRQRRQPARLESKLGDNLAGGDDIEFLSDQEYNFQLARQALQFMQAEFSETTWKACWLQVVQGVPAADVAHQIGVSRNAVYLSKARVLRRLREELHGLMIE